MRLRIAALALFLGAAGVALAAAPAAEFEAACARLPASRFDVVATPLSWQEGETLGIDQLTARGGYQPGVHLTFGLTTANFASQLQTRVHSIDDAGAGRACGTVEVGVALSMQPVVVYLAQELEVSPCARRATMEHELQHVSVFREVLDEAARALAAELPGAFAAGTERAGSQAELQRRLGRRGSEFLGEFVARWQRVLEARQAAVDSPAEYARVKGACPQ